MRQLSRWIWPWNRTHTKSNIINLNKTNKLLFAQISILRPQLIPRFADKSILRFFCLKFQRPKTNIGYCSFNFLPSVFMNAFKITMSLFWYSSKNIIYNKGFLSIYFTCTQEISFCFLYLINVFEILIYKVDNFAFHFV